MIGRWRIKTISTFDPEVGVKQLSLDDVYAMPEGDEKAELMEMACAVLDVSETTMKVLFPLPAESVEEAKADGAVVIDDSYVLVEEHEVKVEDSVFYYNSDASGSIMGEEVNPWQKMELDENGSFVFNPLMIYEKIQ